MNFWKCLSRFCKLRTASPSLAAVCRQSSGCRLPWLYCMLHWSVMSVYIGNCLLCVWWEGKTCRWNPASTDSLAKGRGEWVFLDPLYTLRGASPWLWSQTPLYCWYWVRVKGQAEAYVGRGEQLQGARQSRALSDWEWLPTASDCLTVAFLPSLSCTPCLWMLPVFLRSVRVGVGGTARTSLQVGASAGAVLQYACVVRSSVSRKCPGEPRRCLFSNPEPGDVTNVMPFEVN